MKILIISCLPEEYNNSSMLCVSLLCKGFVENGNTVAVASPKPDENNRYYNPDYVFDEHITHIRFGRRVPKKTENTEREVRNGLLQILLSVYRKTDLFGRSITNLKFVDELTDKIISCGFTPDIIISTSDPKSSHLLCNKIKKKNLFKCPFVQYWGDPLALDIANQSILPVWIKKIIEKSILKQADVVAYVSPLTTNEQKKVFRRYAGKMIFSPTPCEIKEYEGTKNPYVVGYFGSYNSSVRNIMPLYNAVASNSKIKLYIIGDSDVKLESKSNIIIIDRVPAAELEKYYAECGIIVDLMNHKGAQIPAKIYRDAGTNKEVLLITDSKRSDEIVDFFGRFERYSLCSNIASEISTVLDRYIDEGIPQRKPLHEFEYVTVSQKLLDDILQITRR